MNRFRYLWYDLFKFLGLNFEALTSIREKHPTNPHICLYKAILVWLSGVGEEPSWWALADVLEHKLLDPETASVIVSQHFSDEETAKREEYLKGVYLTSYVCMCLCDY